MSKLSPKRARQLAVDLGLMIEPASKGTIVPVMATVCAVFGLGGMLLVILGLHPHSWNGAVVVFFLIALIFGAAATIFFSSINSKHWTDWHAHLRERRLQRHGGLNSEGLSESQMDFISEYARLVAGLDEATRKNLRTDARKAFAALTGGGSAQVATARAYIDMLQNRLPDLPKSTR